jgi:nitrogen-specific signal transduction histidine kinase
VHILALRASLNDTLKGKEPLYEIINAVHDALVVVDKQWCVQVVNSAAETMFRTALYDLKGCSLIELLLSSPESPAALEVFFSRQQDEPQTSLLIPGNVDGERSLLQVRLEQNWSGKAGQLKFSCFTIGRT